MHVNALKLTTTLLLAGLVAFSADTAEARRTRRPRRNHRFLSAKAPERGRTPATQSDGSLAAPSRDVAGSAADGPAGPAGGDSMPQTLDGGAALALSATRALVANPYRGLAVVDVSDADAPVVLGSVALEGSADRLFVDGTTALVVSRRYGAEGGRTVVTAVDLSDEAHPAIVGSASVAGDLAHVVQTGADLVVVTSEYGYWPGPIYMGGAVPKARRGNAGDAGGMAPSYWVPSASKVRVARITRGAGGAPEVVGTYETEGTLAGQDLAGDHLALAVDRTSWGGPWVDDAAAGGGVRAVAADATGLALYDIDVSAAPALAGGTSVADLYGVSSLDAEGGVVRLFGWSYDGANRLETFTLGAGDPAQLGSIDLSAWPSATAFAGGRFVYVVSGDYVWDDTLPGGPGDPGATDPATGNVPRKRGSNTPAPAPSPATLTSIDLSDPAHPTSVGTVDLAPGWVSSLHAVGDDAVATMSDYEGSATHVFRVDLAGTPAVEASAELAGSLWDSGLTGDLLLLSGGDVTEDGAYVPRTIPVSLAGNGVVAGGAVETPSWVAASAWSDPILGLASIDALSLVDLSDLLHPVARGTVRLAVNVSDLAILGDSAAACLVTDCTGGAIEVRTVALPAADALQPLDAVSLGTGDARLFHDGSMLYVLSTDWSNGRGRLTVVDAADPSDLRVRGSLDLASYPGQAFLVNGAMVLLREAWSLVATDETTGRMHRVADPFGRAPTGWTRDEQNAVVDVVDLSDPDQPRAAIRKRIRWDWGGEAILRGTTLYVPSYVTVGWSREGWERYAYGVRGIELSDPLHPRVHGLVWVPGSLTAAADDSGRVLTVSYDWDDTALGFSARLNLCDLASGGWRSRVVATHDLPGSADTVVAGAEHAYVVTESWDPNDGSVAYELDALGLSDLTLTSSQARDAAAWGGTIAGGHLFLRTWGWTGALDAYDLADPAQPAFEVSAEVDGIGTDVGVAGGRAYVPAGYRGVLGFDLSR